MSNKWPLLKGIRGLPFASLTNCSEEKSSCPVKSVSNSSAYTPQTHKELCPVKSEQRYKNPNQYNVYSQKLDPRNQMPTNLTVANSNLPAERVKSNIPKAGTDQDSWLYPSPQMFYNALSRKNKLEGAREEDMETVVAVHNNMNENTWAQVLAWENLHNPANRGAGRESKLLRFMGRPHDLSPKAQIKMFFGHLKPFDRHDWIVDRGGTEVRYVIDYYHDESAVQLDKRPEHLTDLKSIKSIQVDVRPALDSFEAAYDLFFRMPIKYVAGNAGDYFPPPFFPQHHVKAAEGLKKNRLHKTWKVIQETCASCKDKVRTCSSEADCGAASVALQLCISKVVCPSIYRDFEIARSKLNLSGKAEDEYGVAMKYSSIVTCLDNFELDSRQK